MTTSNFRQLSAISRLFFPSVFREMAAKGRSSMFSRLFNIIGTREFCERYAEATVADGFEFAFEALKRAGLRGEYVYRQAITEKVLLGKHSLNTASMLTEFRAGACKADVVILNDTASVYEIKSERDSLFRLANQVSNYRKVFASVNVITGEKHIDAVTSSVPEDVGVMCLSSRFQISVAREATDQPGRVCPATVFDSLRICEATAMLKDLGVPVPDVPNTRQHKILRQIFAEQDPSAVHQAMVTTLKRTRSLAPLKDFVGALPSSLRAIALSVRVDRKGRDRVVAAVSTPLNDAINWA